MSIRAYRVNSIKYNKVPTIKPGDDEEGEAFDYLEDHASISSEGILEVSVQTLRDCVYHISMPGHTRDALLKDIAWAEKKKQDCVLYHIW